jgi:DHA1 family multidrug resistance protein-like MFS transporter
VSRARARRVTAALGVQVFFLMLGLGIIAPVLPLYARSFGISVTAVGFLVTLFGLARLGADLPTGHLAERIGRRPLLVGGALAAAAGAFGFAYARTYPELLLWRLLQGVGSATTTTAAAIAVTELAPPDERGRALSLYQGTLLLGAGAGPVLGGVLATHLGPRAPFLVLGALALAAALWALRLPETRPRTPTPAPAAVGDAAPARDPRPREAWRTAAFWTVSLFTLTIFASRSGGQTTLLPLFGADRLGLDTATIGLALTVLMAFNVGALYLSGLVSDRWGRTRAIVPGGVLTTLALAALPSATETATFLLWAACLGLGIGIAGPAPAAYIADLAPPHRLGRTMGLYRTIADLGLMAGPVLLGWISEHRNYRAGFAANAAAVAAATLLVAVGARERDRAASGAGRRP